ncbi:putative fatty acyl-CoA reductase CG5065 [Cylas formicarius]|uniref:putative fatty acyl-CoA reductase CG5065 n=1 Tax=Cylas formicarius TaxID=197179 RepID=UPI0029588EDE|nr:putative fatty acyl-CoA reductase CG5065 [Cylas formicarius]
MSEETSEVAEWFRGKSVFLSGGSGFMGKVMLEKLLYTCRGVEKIYVLLRNKRGRTPQQRIDDMWKLPMFERLRRADPDAIRKVVPVNGDLYSERLGLKNSDARTLAENVHVVFHMAATLKLEAKLKDAVEQNTCGTAAMLDLAKTMIRLRVFCHFSTAYCSADIDVFEEKVYPSKDNPRDVIDVVKWMNPKALDLATPAIIAPHPNTYTYSKRLAETLVASEKDVVPVCIVRPSVVCPAALEPLPGWVDSLNGPMGLLVAAGKGVLRSMHCIGTNRAQVIPVDYAINASIVAAYKRACQESSEEVPVYNLTQDEVIKITMGEILEKGRAVVHRNPFEMQVWYPDGDIRSSKLTHLLCCVLMHWLPALLIDGLMFVFRQKRFMIHVQRRIHDGLELLQFFTTRQWYFESKRFLKLWDEMSEADRKAFPMDFNALPIDEYLENSVLGARQYTMKEPPSSLPRCRVQQKVLYVIHKLFVFAMYYYLFYLLSRFVPPLRMAYDFVWRTNS